MSQLGSNDRNEYTPVRQLEITLLTVEHRIDTPRLAITTVTNLLLRPRSYSTVWQPMLLNLKQEIDINTTRKA